MYDDIVDATKLTNFALKIVIDEKLNAFKDALNEIAGESENGDGESENTNNQSAIKILTDVSGTPAWSDWRTWGKCNYDCNHSEEEGHQGGVIDFRHE